MKKFIDSLMLVVKKYTVMDFAIFKICLVSIGLLLGAYLSSFFLDCIWAVWIVFTLSYLFIMYKTFIKYRK